jgi:hypothetical protein
MGKPSTYHDGEILQPLTFVDKYKFNCLRLYAKRSSLFAGGITMPSLQVRELPEHIYQSLCHEAEVSHRSIAQQAVAALAKGLSLDLAPQMRRKALLSAIRAGAELQDAKSLPDPAEFIREDRDR